MKLLSLPLGLSKTHAGNFAQGQAGASYTVTVSNPTPAGASGTVTVTETVPVGMTLVSMAGTGWTCPGTEANNCTRNDPLAAGQNYPPLTVTVNVASNAASQVTNQVSVSGGGSVSASYSDPTTIAAGPVLSIAKTADAASVVAGAVIGYTVTVSNSSTAGTGTATSVTLNDPLPAGTGISWSISPAYSGPGTCSVTGAAGSQTLACDFGNLAAGATAPVHVTSSTSASSCATYSNTATASATNSSSVQSSASTTVQCQTSFTPIRVNAGGEAYTDSLSQLWSADTGYQQSGSSSTAAAITGTSDPTLYQTEHFSTTGSLTYQFSVPNGSYTAKLKFAEIYYTGAGQRVFDVALNGTTVQSHLDIFAAAGGGDKAYDLSYPVTVSGGHLTITLTAVTGYPKISAIEITSGSATPDFTVAASPSSQSVLAGGSTTYTITTTGVNSFSGTVSFSASGLPTGATASFSPTTVAGSGSTTMTVTTGSATPAGTSSLTVTATSGTLTHTAGPSLVVTSTTAFTPIRVNAGGPAYTDSLGQLWSADTGYQQAGSFSTTAGIAGTSDATLYQTEHYSATGSLTYQFAVPNGTYTVKLRFAEIWYTSAGQRVFNVKINGTTVQPNLDVFAAAGGADRAYDLSCPVTVSGGQVTISLTAVAGNPKISAIEIL